MENVNQIADSVGNIQLNFAGIVPSVPGEILPYELPVGEVEESFESITSCAITESGQGGGPLGEEQLKEFLRHKLNRKKESTERIILENFTTDVMGLQDQLDRLLNRINEIVRKEKERTDLFYERIRELMEALEKRKRLSYLIGLNLERCNAARDAFQEIGRGDPLTEDQLKTFIQTGMYPTSAENGLSGQLNRLRRRLDSKLDIENSTRKYIIEKIKKAIDDIRKECVNLRYTYAVNENVSQ